MLSTFDAQRADKPLSANPSLVTVSDATVRSYPNSDIGPPESSTLPVPHKLFKALDITVLQTEQTVQYSAKLPVTL